METSRVEAMCRVMRHRGPDDEGTFFAPGVGLGMRRLSIIDVAGGRQPLFNEDKTLALVFNGEVYNFVELRRSLQARGHAFSTASDGEVILHLYEEKGVAAWDDLNGMYAFCLYDLRRREGHLVRDRLGVKPLYYWTSNDGNELAFASELKGLLRAGVPRRLDESAILKYLAFMVIPDPGTPFRGVRKLSPGGHLRFHAEGVEAPRRYWNVPAPSPRPFDDAVERETFLRLMEDAIRIQSRSDVPVGVFLSGGLDSSLITALYTRLVKSPVLSFNVRYDGAAVDEGPYADLVARTFGCRHHSITVGLDEVREDLPRLLWHMDEPHADPALVAAYRVAASAAPHVKVLLNGTGGDEIFGGYERYRPSAWPLRAWHAAPAPFRELGQAALRLLPAGEDFRRKVAGNASPDATYLWRLLQFKPSHLAGFFPGADYAPAGDPAIEALFAAAPADPPNRYMNVDLRLYLVDDLLLLLDKTTMAASVEGRVPLLDHRLVEWAAGVDGRAKVRGTDLKSSVKRWLRGTLPDEVLDRPKQGFGAPTRRWMTGGFFEATVRLLDGRPPARDHFYWGERGGRLAGRLRRLNAQQAYALLALEVWLRVFVEDEPAADLSARLYG